MRDQQVVERVSDLSAEWEPRSWPSFLQTHWKYKECTCMPINLEGKKRLQVYIYIKFINNVNCKWGHITDEVKLMSFSTSHWIFYCVCHKCSLPMVIRNINVMHYILLANEMYCIYEYHFQEMGWPRFCLECSWGPIKIPIFAFNLCVIKEQGCR